MKYILKQKSSLSKIIYASTNYVNFLSFDNDDRKPSKRQVTFLSLIWGLNHNINKQNLAKFGFALSLQKPFKEPVERRGRLWSQPNFTELSLKLSNYELRTLFNEAKCGLRTTPRVTVIRRRKRKIFFKFVKSKVVTSVNIHEQNYFKNWTKHGIKRFSNAEAEKKNVLDACVILSVTFMDFK